MGSVSTGHTRACFEASALQPVRTGLSEVESAMDHHALHGSCAKVYRAWVDDVLGTRVLGLSLGLGM